MVSPTESITGALERNWEMIDSALQGLDDAILRRQPTEQSNSIAWILWYMSRVVDTFIHTRLRDSSQLWVSDGWHIKFGMDQDPDDRGVGSGLDRSPGCCLVDAGAGDPVGVLRGD